MRRRIGKSTHAGLKTDATKAGANTQRAKEKNPTTRYRANRGYCEKRSFRHFGTRRRLGACVVIRRKALAGLRRCWRRGSRVGGGGLCRPRLGPSSLLGLSG